MLPQSPDSGFEALAEAFRRTVQVGAVLVTGSTPQSAPPESESERENSIRSLPVSASAGLLRTSGSPLLDERRIRRAATSRDIGCGWLGVGQMRSSAESRTSSRRTLG